MDNYKEDYSNSSDGNSIPPQIPNDTSLAPVKMTKKELKANQKAQKIMMKAQKKAYKASKPFYKKWWFWLIVIVVLVGVFGSNGKKKNNSTAPTTTSNATQGEQQTSTTSPKNQVYGVGETVDLNGLKITINSAVNTDEADLFNNSSNLGEGNTYEIIDVTIENGTDKDVAVSSIMSFTLKDENGRSASLLPSGRGNGQPDGTVLPGDKLSGELLYEVPRNGELNLFFTPSAFGKSIKFKIR